MIGVVPHGHWKTTTLIAALDLGGVRCSTLVDGAVNADVFGSFCDQVLCPQLREGDLVVMDNLSSHKVAGVQAAIEARGATLLFLPPYSPDLNPIEQVFAKLKRLLRSAQARTKDALWTTIGNSLDHFSRDKCLRYIHHAGYQRQSG